MEPATSQRPRRTQQQRRTATRRLLLDATVQCLIEQGYAGTTTLEVERRAGVSRGARIHHFPTKASLLAAVVDHLYDRLADHYDRAFGSIEADGSDDGGRFCQGLGLLWSIYSQPDYAAVLELNIASRTDPELGECLKRVGDRHRALALSAANRHFPVLEDELALGLIETLHATFLGLRMQEDVDSSKVMPLLEQLVVVHFAEPARP